MKVNYKLFIINIHKYPMYRYKTMYISLVTRDTDILPMSIVIISYIIVCRIVSYDLQRLCFLLFTNSATYT